MRTPTRLILAAACGLLACGGDEDDITTGVGTGTLRVDARFVAVPVSKSEEALGRSQLISRFEVDVFDAAGAPVSGASVIVDTESGPVALREGGCARRYCGEKEGYGETYVLSVVRGLDVLSDAAFGGPRLHILELARYGQIDASEPLSMTWEPYHEADETSFETVNYAATIDGDPGAHDLPPGALYSTDNATVEQYVRVQRALSLDLTGGLPGSRLTIAVRNGKRVSTDPPT